MSNKKHIFPIIVVSFQSRTDGGPTEMVVHDEFPLYMPPIYRFEAETPNAYGYFVGRIHNSGTIKPSPIYDIKEPTEFCVCPSGTDGQNDIVILEKFAPIKTDFGTALYRWFPRYKDSSKGISQILFRIPVNSVEKYAVIDSFKYDSKIPDVAEIKHLTDKVICFKAINEDKTTRFVFYNTYTGQVTPIILYNTLDVVMNDEGNRIRIVKKEDLGTQRGFIIDKESAELIRKYFPDSNRNLNRNN